MVPGTTVPLATSLLAYCKSRSPSVKRSIWLDHAAACENVFAGGTDEEDEDKALNIILGSESYEELAFIIESLTWTEMDDELDERDLTNIAGRIRDLRNRREHLVDRQLRALALEPETFADIPAAQTAAAINQRVTWLGPRGQAGLAGRLLDSDRRGRLLDSIALFALRGLTTHAREFGVLAQDLATRLPASAAALQSLAWDAFYDDLVCTQLEQARYGLLFGTLPDMIDPGLPVARRSALFDTLNRRESELRALQDYITELGTIQQQTDVQRFMDARQVFMNNFTTAPPTDGVIGQIAAFFDSLASDIQALRADVAGTADQIAALTLGHLTDAEQDDLCRNVVGTLDGVGRLGLLPTQWKSELIFRMEEGNADDDDEHAILQVLAASKARSVAEFAQLVTAQNWETLSFSFDGQEYDDLEQMLTTWP